MGNEGVRNMNAQDAVLLQLHLAVAPGLDIKLH